ncbi:MAG: hypothetical protein ABI165_01050 [Bryobacteraceae bacterium]
MKFLAVLAVLLPLAAQEPSPKPEPSEPWLTGFVDLGYRWRTDVGGSANTYRSIVNLGSGPKLLGTEFTITDPKARAFDRIDVRAYNWGDDPYSTFHVDARKNKLYNFTADYRNIAYFNDLPSFADPLLARGIILNERSLDTHRRFSSFQLDLLPGNWFVPYAAYERDSGYGNGVTTFVGDGNEYAVPDQLHDATGNYRAGVRFELRRFHVTLEQGGTTFKDDQSAFSGSNTRNLGNVLSPLLGQTQYLSSLLQSYGIRGDSIYSKGLATASPTSWLDLYGQFLYSRPNTDVHYRQYDTGNLALLSQALFYTEQQYLLSAEANLPHTSGSVGAELRPFRGVRILESWLTDRLSDSGSSLARQTLLPATLTQPADALLSSSLITNYNQQQIEVLFDVTSRLTLRGGYRYVWGDGSNVTLPPSGLAGLDRGQLRRNVGLGGFAYHPNQKLSVTGDFEGASSGDTYFRTSLHDYQKLRARARYQLTQSLNVSADVNLLNNQNPTPGIHYDFLARQESLSFQWTPDGGKRWGLQGGYTRSTLRSDINYLAPQDLHSERSFYRDNAHEMTGAFDTSLRSAKLSLGGSFFISSGSRPTNFYQPVAKLSVPLRNKLSWISEWRYYGFGESFYLYEGFRTHLVTTGLRFTR